MSDRFEERRRRLDEQQPFDQHEEASEDVLSAIAEAERAEEPAPLEREDAEPDPLDEPAPPEPTAVEPEPEAEPEQPEPAAVADPALEPEPAPELPPEPEPAVVESEPEPEPVAEHAAGGFSVPDGYATLAGTPNGARRSVGVVVSRFNGEITSRLLERALETLAAEGVARDAVTVVPVPGAFELPLAAMAIAKTRRFACVVALGCVVRGETPHFDFVAGEAASGLQLAALETGVPVSFGVLTCDTAEQAEARVERAADAARGALEMADLFAQLRASQQAQAG